jgi:hypothetical protein
VVDDDVSDQVPAHYRKYIVHSGGVRDPFRRNPVDRDIYFVELILRIHEEMDAVKLLSSAETNEPDGAYARQVGVRRLYVNGNEI